MNFVEKFGKIHKRQQHLIILKEYMMHSKLPSEVDLMKVLCEL